MEQKAVESKQGHDTYDFKKMSFWRLKVSTKELLASVLCDALLHVCVCGLWLSSIMQCQSWLSTDAYSGFSSELHACVTASFPPCLRESSARWVSHTWRQTFPHIFPRRFFSTSFSRFGCKDKSVVEMTSTLTGLRPTVHVFDTFFENLSTTLREGMFNWVPSRSQLRRD